MSAAFPEAFLTGHKNTLITDEVQMVSELFRALKVVDDLRQKDKENANGRYLLTGSANILALPKLSEPLVGRMTVLTLYPFSSAEASKGKRNGLEKLLALDFTDITDQNKPDLFSRVVENFVATELTKLLSFGNVRAQLLHFRTSDGKEVDFILERPDYS